MLSNHSLGVSELIRNFSFLKSLTFKALSEKEFLFSYHLHIINLFKSIKAIRQDSPVSSN